MNNLFILQKIKKNKMKKKIKLLLKKIKKTYKTKTLNY